MRFEVESAYLDHYTVYYYPNPAHIGGSKMENNEKLTMFPAGRSFGVIGGLDEEQEYLFSIAAIILFNRKIQQLYMKDSGKSLLHQVENDATYSGGTRSFIWAFQIIFSNLTHY